MRAARGARDARRATLRASLWLVASFALAACETGQAPKGHVSAEPAVRKPTFVRASSAATTVAPFVKGEIERAAARGERVVVYVGATWCEPCQHFHQAVLRGDLDQAFGGIRFVEFDLDRDRDALERDGYRAPMIPLFAIPLSDGRASGHMMNGSIKGPNAVSENIAPRLGKLLDESP